MGKASRQRRREANAARSRTVSDRRATTGRASRASEPHDDLRRRAASVLGRLVEHPFRPAEPQLSELAGFDEAIVGDLVETGTTSLLTGLWSRGWQPAEVLRQTRRTSATTATLARYLIAADYGARRADTMDHRWRVQVDSLGLPGGVRTTGWLRRCAVDEGLSPHLLYRDAVDLMRCLARLPVLETLIPPPGATTVNAAAPTDAGSMGSHPMLARIRALLAKAESTPYEAEAAAFTAKATELMTRHAIDAALLAGPGAESPVTVRVAIDAPYVDAKSLLLQTVAQHARCRTVFLPSVEMSTVIGFPCDVVGTEVLFTSLLVQAQRALAEAARHAPPGTRVRSQSYRCSFLAGFTRRISERLAETNEAIIAEVDATDRRTLPALRSRELAVDDVVQARFGTLQTSRVRSGSDAAGWAGGRQAADLAQLHAGAVNV